ncbi:MAG TPA: QueT transporter family protein [candidate division Zixibacteria bacterium]|nr:QueT transporter family protein [candidate division Zixibacteria bacterium]
MKALSVRQLSIAGLIAALYAILSIVFQPISFGLYQVRIAEALTVLPFLTGAAIPGLFIGCVLANVIGGMGWLDIVVGPLLTLVAALLTRAAYHLSRRSRSRWLSVIPFLLLWAGGICLLTGLSYNLSIGIGISLSVLGIALVMLSESHRGILENLNYIVLTAGALCVLISGYFLYAGDNNWMGIVGELSLLAAALVGMLLARIHKAGDNLNMIIAPLPPVLLNAFGVSIYLAPIMGTSYWFAVQMVGVGQLVACYLIGLPLLMLLRRRSLFLIDNQPDAG